ncbi:MAG TPA: chitobiase/beta-hexosaminidase C-terminal domain-containing protein [Opitutaceae bacterium]|nr:chitobiase/beta-hexosaminidase C-terminal domain-containing protein [Opitutaceae bacterium]
MKNKLPAYAICLALLAPLACVKAASPTDGFVQYDDTFTVQKPYDLNISDRFAATDAGGGLLQFNCWIHSGDHPLYITSNTAPRTEMRWNTNWTTTERIWEADVMIDPGSEGTAIQQIKSNSGFEPIYINVHNSGNLYNDGGSTVLASNMLGKWFHLMCAYNPTTGIGRAWINGNLVVTRSDPHPITTVWYFKNGTYGTKGVSETHYKNVRFWSHDQTGIAQAPSFRPLDATYSNAQLITLWSSTPGVSIRYTLDGSTPTATSGTLYTGPFPLSTNATINAVAFKSGMTTSSVSWSAYKFLSTTFQVADPVHSVPTGVYSGPQSVAITTPTAGAAIRYTTDGSIPTETHGTLYAGPVTIGPGDTTLQAVAYLSGQVTSRVSYGFYIVSGTSQVADPTFSPAAGTYASAQSVTISSATSGATIRYTTDGSTPSETVGTVYSNSPVSITSTTTLTAIAYKAGSADSNVVSAIYTINSLPPAAAPVFSPGGGTYATAQTVTITSATSGASIRYTTDGSTPSETAGTVYSGPVSISASGTLKAIAYAAGFSDSTVTSAAYTIGSPQTLNFEAESLSYTGSGATTSVQTDKNSSGGKWVELAGNSTGDHIDFTVPNVPAGTYQLKMEWKGNNTRGILQLSVDGANLGPTLDQYASGQTYPTTTFGNVTFSAAGSHDVRLTVTGKNSKSSSYQLSADKFTFTGQ